MATQVTYSGNGSQTQFDITFPYDSPDQVHAYVAGETSTYTWVNPSRIELPSAPAAGVPVLLRRITSVATPVVDFSDGAVLTESDLDTTVRQLIWREQELGDAGSDLEGRALRVRSGDAAPPMGPIADFSGKVFGVSADGLGIVPVSADSFTTTTAMQVLADLAAADRAQTGLDRAATGDDRVQTGLDRAQTGYDRAQTGTDVVSTTTSRNAAQLASAIAGSYPNGAASNVPRGLTQASVGALTAGTGGTPGTYTDGTWTGGNFTVNPTFSYTIDGAGHLTAFNVTGPGVYIGTSGAMSLPTPVFGHGLSGAAVALTAQFLVASGQGYWVQSPDNTQLLHYLNVSGTATPDSTLGPITLSTADFQTATDIVNNSAQIAVNVQSGTSASISSGNTWTVGALSYAATLTATGLFGVKALINTLGNGSVKVIIATGSLAGTLTVKSTQNITFLGTGLQTVETALKGLAGEHVFIVANASGPTLGWKNITGSTQYYNLSPGSLTPSSTFTVSAAANQAFCAVTLTHVTKINTAPTPAYVTPTMYVMFLIAGQSNGQGQGSSALAPTMAAGMAYQYYGGSLTPITGDPVGNANTGSAWPAFANEFYLRTGMGVIFVPAAVLGSALQAVATTSFGNWSSTGTHRATAISAVQAAQTAASSAGLAWQFGGVLWIQGETDADGIDGGPGKGTAAGYVTEGDSLVTAFEAAFGVAGAGTMPFLIWRTGTKITGDTAGYAAIRGAQMQLAQTYPNVRLVHTGTINFAARSLMIDTYHYSQDGLNEMGTVGGRIAAYAVAGGA